MKRPRITVTRGLLLELPLNELRDVGIVSAGTSFRWPVPVEYRMNDSNFLLPIAIAQRVLIGTVYNTYRSIAYVRLELEHNAYVRYRC